MRCGLCDFVGEVRSEIEGTKMEELRSRGGEGIAPINAYKGI
jgi:hypothetical protein